MSINQEGKKTFIGYNGVENHPIFIGQKKHKNNKIFFWNSKYKYTDKKNGL